MKTTGGLAAALLLPGISVLQLFAADQIPPPQITVPTLFLFDRSGNAAGVLYGAPPGLHEEVTGLLSRAMQP
jgi:hypothetical protein